MSRDLSRIDHSFATMPALAGADRPRLIVDRRGWAGRRSFTIGADNHHRASHVMNMRRLISGWMTAAARAIAALTTVSVLCVTASGARVQDPAKSDDQESKIRESVVKISATMRYPDMTHPWTKHSPQDASGTGVVIDGKRILTNAHVVLYASQLFVESYQSSDKLPARVEAVSPGIDLAVIRLEDESFFEKRSPGRAHRGAAGGEGYGPGLRVSAGRVDAVGHQGNRFEDRVCGIRRRHVGRARSGRRGDQSGQQRRAGDRGRQDGRADFQQARPRPTISATSFRARRSTCFSRTLPMGTTTASPRFTNRCRPSRTTRSGRF